MLLLLSEDVRVKVSKVAAVDEAQALERAFGGGQ